MKKVIITADTPLSALIRETHHEELSLFLKQWRHFLKGDHSKIVLLQLSYFEFDLECVNVGMIYRHLAQLINHDAVIPNVTVLARYMVEHSNLAIQWKSVYRQINRYIGIYQ